MHWLPDSRGSHHRWTRAKLTAALDLYFAFADGLLGYDCPTCDQRCCKGGGLGVRAGDELRTLVQLRPSIQAFSASAGPHVHQLVNFDAGCWFLDGTKCGLFAQAARPSACRTYPFNVFGIVHNTLTVTPHPYCPLTVRPGLSGVRHTVLGTLFGEVGLAGSAPAEVTLNRIPNPLPLEAYLRDATKDFCTADSYTEFAVFSSAAADKPLDESDLHQKWAAWSEFLGVAPELHGPKETELLVAFSPALRLDALQFSPPDLPLALFALYFYLRLATDISEGSFASYRTLVELTNSVHPMLWALVHLDDMPRLVAAPAWTAAESLSKPEDVKAAEAFRVLIEGSAPTQKSLREIVETTLPGPGVQRNALLMRLIPIIESSVGFS